MEINLTMEQLQAAKEAKSPEELVALAKEQGYDITLEQAAAFLNPDAVKTGEIADEELDNVAGGGCGGTSKIKCSRCSSTNVEVKNLGAKYTSYKCRDCNYSWIPIQ